MSSTVHACRQSCLVRSMKKTISREPTLRSKRMCGPRFCHQIRSSPHTDGIFMELFCPWPCFAVPILRFRRNGLCPLFIIWEGRLAQAFRGLRLESIQFGNEVYFSLPRLSTTAITSRAVPSLSPATFIGALQTVTRPSLRVAQSLP